MEEFSNGQEAEEGRFQELEEDVLEDWVNIGEIKEAKDCSFGKIYNPIRALFAADSIVLEKFSNCIDHMERLKFLVEMQVVKNSLADITVSSPKLKEEDFPKRTEETTPPRKPAPKLSQGANKKYPHLSKSVEVRSSKAEGGRHMVAKQKILPGEIIIVEPALSTSLFRKFYPSHCLHCFRRLEEDSIVSCPSCDTVKFCSQTCLSNGWELHQWECCVLDYVDSSDIGHMATLAYRLLAAQQYQYLIDNLDKFDKKEASYKKGDYLSAYKQEDNMDARPSGDHLKRCVTALILARCLQLTEWFPEDQRSSLDTEEVLTVTALLVRHIQQCACNAYEINELVRCSSMIDSHSAELGGAVYPTISLSNHSCINNTSRTNFGTTGVLRATRTIYPNERVFDNYGYFYHVENKEHRQQMLAAQYFFDCNCTACKEDWPTYRDLARREPSYSCYACSNWLGSNPEKVKKCPKCKKDTGPVAKVARRIQDLQKDFRSIMDGISEENAENNIKTFSALLQEVEKVCKPPCRELVTCQQVLLQCFAMLANTFKVEIDPKEAQLVPFTGQTQDSESEDDSDDDDFGMPGLI